MNVLLTPSEEDLDTTLQLPVVLVLGRGGCVKCSDLAVVASTWTPPLGVAVALVLLDDAAGLRLRALHDFVHHLDVLPAVVPMSNGEPLAVMHGSTVEVLERAADRLRQV